MTVIAYSSARHNKYHQNAEPSLSAAQPAHPCLSPTATPKFPNSLPASPVFFAAMRNPSVQTAPGDVTREVALKAIPKKKAKRNEESVWSEMGSSRVSIIQSWVFAPPFFFLHDALERTRPRLSPNMFGYLPVGQIPLMVRVMDKILPRFPARCRRRAL